MKIIDITRSLYPGMPVYPGGPKTIFEPIGQLPKDRSISTKITIGSHAGTHVDAPNHIMAGAWGVDSYPLEKFMGEAVVIDLTNVNTVISERNLQNVIARTPTLRRRTKQSQRDRHARHRARDDKLIFLLKTKNSSIDWSVFHEDFVALDESAAQYLVSIQPKLIGIDGPSIKKFRFPDQTHQIILSQNIPIIEWLDLGQVKAEIYQFIGFPLPLQGLDGSPARAVLVK